MTDLACENAPGLIGPGFPTDTTTCRKWFGRCVVAGCGDLVCATGETCATCPQDCGACPRCGDGIVQPSNGEECDLGAGNTGTYGGCTSSCKLAPRCGDGIVQGAQGETCDLGASGNTGANCGCTSSCRQAPCCGDGVCSKAETCRSCAADCGACVAHTCSGATATPTAQTFLLDVADANGCALFGQLPVFANDMTEATACARALGLFVDSSGGPAASYTCHTDPTYGCVSFTFSAFSEASAVRCAVLGHGCTGWGLCMSATGEPPTE